MIHTIKKYLNSHPTLTSKEIIKKIGCFDVVSFDMFDTIIRRNVPEPYFLFEMVANQITENMDMVSFKDDRIKAAQKAKESVWGKGREEVTLDAIYSSLPGKYKNMIEQLKKKEIENEINSCFPDQTLLEVYEWCIKNKKIVNITTDTYLPENVIKKILGKCGYCSYSGLYISCEVNKTKRTGSLYHFIKSLYPDKRIIHVGDNIRSDFLNAKRCKITSIKVAKYPLRTRFFNLKNVSRQNYSQYSNLNKVINYSLKPDKSFFYHYGYECLGPLLCGFCKNLDLRAKRQNIKKIYFLSRDGYLIKKVFDILYNSTDRKTEYLYISRKSIQLPLLSRCESLEKYFLLNGTKKKWNYEMFSNRLGIIAEDKLKVWEECGLESTYRFKAEDIDKNKKIYLFFNCFKEQCMKKSRESATLVKRYLQQNGFCGNLAIVDTGGYGTTQKCMEYFCKIYDIDVSITGFYLWLYDNPGLRAHVYPFCGSTSYGGETLITELPLTSKEGTTEGYDIAEEGEILPVLADYEYSYATQMQGVIEEIQAGVQDFARFIKDAIDVIPMPANVTYANVKRVSRYPSLFESRMFGELMFFSDHYKTYLARPQKIHYYITHPKNLYQDFANASWKIAFLKRLFKVPISYYFVIKTIRKFKDK